MFSVAKRGFAAGNGRAKYVEVEDEYDPATAPRCLKCGVDYSPRRAEAGKKTCLDCGDPQQEYALVPTHKGAYTPVTPGTKLTDLSGDKNGHAGF
jgi:uncharacterized OB-fold protein